VAKKKKRLEDVDHNHVNDQKYNFFAPYGVNCFQTQI